MDLDNIYVSAYLENLCLQFGGTKEDSQAQQIFKELKEILPPQDFDQVAAFNLSVSAFRRIYNSGEHPEANAEILTQYENTIELTKLPKRYKFKLYDDLLSYYEKNQNFSTHYFGILNKQIALLDYGNDAALSRIAMQAAIAHRSVAKEIYLKTLQRAYNKCANKAAFPKRESELKIKIPAAKKGEVAPKGTENVSKEDLRNRIAVIHDILKNKDLLAAEKISLALEVIDLATKTPFYRSKNFALKRDMHRLIAQEYAACSQFDLAGKHEAEAQRWQKNIDNAIDKGYAKYPQKADKYR